MIPTWSDADRAHMQRAIEIARPHRPHPNPRVGCVLVRDGVVMGEGAHRAVGEDHAEVVALAVAGMDAAGSTAYVTLEPCAHTGRTPPCVDALIEAGVSEVVVAVADPDTQVAGAGIERLGEAGVGVRVGLLAGEAVELDPAYHHHRRTGRPWVRAILTHPDLSEEGVADLDELIAGLDRIVTGRGPDLDPTDPTGLQGQLLRLGTAGYVELGVGDDADLLEALARASWIDQVTLYSRSSIPDWGPVEAGGPYSVQEVRSIGRDVRIDAQRQVSRTD